MRTYSRGSNQKKCSNFPPKFGQIANILLCLCLITFAMQMTAFIAGVILLLNLWIGKRAGVSVAPEKAMADIDRCLYVLKTLENR